MFCPQCGADVRDGAIFCPQCGAALSQPAANPIPSEASAGSGPAAASAPAAEPIVNPAEPIVNPVPKQEYDKKGRPIPNPDLAPAHLTRNEFFKEFTTHKSSVKCAAILGYISAGITLIMIMAGALDAYSLIDVVALVALSLLIQLVQSRVCAILYLCYAVYNTIAGLVMNGQFAGWLIIIAGICGVIGTFGFHKDWKNYKARTAEADIV